MTKDNYIKIFDKFIDIIDWSVLQRSTFMLNTDYKVSKLFTQDHLKMMIYYHRLNTSDINIKNRFILS